MGRPSLASLDDRYVQLVVFFDPTAQCMQARCRRHGKACYIWGDNSAREVNCNHSTDR